MGFAFELLGARLYLERTPSAVDAEAETETGILAEGADCACARWSDVFHLTYECLDSIPFATPLFEPPVIRPFFVLSRGTRAFWLMPPATRIICVVNAAPAD
jgi:hypothetical protein